MADKTIGEASEPIKLYGPRKTQSTVCDVADKPFVYTKGKQQIPSSEPTSTTKGKNPSILCQQSQEESLRRMKNVPNLQITRTADGRLRTHNPTADLHSWLNTQKQS